MITGVDVGQARDPSAVVQLARGDDGGWRVAAAETFPLDTAYREVAAYAAAASAFGPVVVDASGVGRPVLEATRGRGARRVIGVTTTAGSVVRCRGDDVTVPKTALVRTTQAALEHGQVQIPATVGGRLLARQLRAMRRDRRGRMNARPGAHDDVAFALFLAVWAAMRNEDT